MNENIDYSTFDKKECVKQALYHSLKISSLFDGSREQTFFSIEHMANVMHSMWLENENVRRQLEILDIKNEREY